MKVKAIKFVRFFHSNKIILEALVFLVSVAIAYILLLGTVKITVIVALIFFWVLVRTQKINLFFWWVYHLSGARLILTKVHAPAVKDKEQRPPSSFLLWLVGIYSAFFSLSLAKYDQAVSQIKDRANNFGMVVQQQGFELKDWSEAAAIQSTPCPIRPDFLRFWRTFSSNFSKPTDPNVQVVNQIKTYVRLKKSELKDSKLIGLDLRNIDMRNSVLDGANLENTLMNGSNFSNSSLKKAKFTNVTFDEANFHDSDFFGSTIIYCSAIGTSFQDASFAETKIYGVNFEDSKMGRVNFLGATLCSVILFEPFSPKPWDLFDFPGEAYDLEGLRVRTSLKYDRRFGRPDLKNLKSSHYIRHDSFITHDRKGQRQNHQDPKYLIREELVSLEIPDAHKLGLKLTSIGFEVYDFKKFIDFTSDFIQSDSCFYKISCKWFD